MRKLSWLILLSAFVFIGCKPSLLPNSLLDDTKENRAIAAFMEKYRLAVESRSIGSIMDLVSKDYHDDKSAMETADIEGPDALQKKLEKTFARIKLLRLTIHLQNIFRDKNTFQVIYHYSEHLLTSLPAAETWNTLADVNRMVLRMKGKKLSDGFEIVSGL